MGTTVFRLPLDVFVGTKLFVIGDAKLTRAILTDKGTTKPMNMYENFNNMANGAISLFASNGSYWHARRKAIAPAFSSQHVQRMNAIAIANCDEWLETKLKPLAKEGKSFDAEREMIDLMLSTISESAFQYKMSPTEMDAFKEDLATVANYNLLKTSLGRWRMAISWLLTDRQAYGKAATRIQALCYKLIAIYKQLENPTKEPLSNSLCATRHTTMMQNELLTQMDSHGHTACCCDHIGMGTDGPCSTPTASGRLRRSIQQDDLQPPPPHQLESVHQTIRESMRLHPVVAVSARSTGKDFITKQGKLIPAGSLAVMSYFVVMRDQSIFAEEADEFKPARWENPTKDMTCAFMPFGAGQQNCVGQKLASVELHCILPRIISQFELIVDDPGRPKYVLVVSPANCLLKAKLVAHP
ncbi:P450/NADPH--P450 reductase [Seminavis robusta]|uniref:P450/NADPH--P450 reductase n=1 Tax=Seminavis robusta TaxID=568900 RepID=A0A9N8H309_9STRA|nr:P450/NADPH--P450 reductase [Seminavis robusta]|eukprot:Sro18_g012860.1 P450/NADPH--P450 reductase (413) ;mRNA; r:84652-86250